MSAVRHTFFCIDGHTAGNPVRLVAGGAPLLQWSLNGSPAQTGNSITLRPGGQGQGSASLSLVASAGNSTATADLSLLFGKEPSFNVFGL